MSRMSYEMSKHNKLVEIDNEIEKLQQESKALEHSIDNAPDESEMTKEQLAAFNEMLSDLDAIKEEIQTLEEQYADLEEETYEDSYADFKYDQWKGSRDEDE